MVRNEDGGRRPLSHRIPFVLFPLVIKNVVRYAVAAVVLGGVLAPLLAGGAAAETLFGKSYIEITDPTAAPKWDNAVAALKRDQRTLARCVEGQGCATRAVRAWRKLIADVAADPRGPVVAVNALVNDRVAEVADDAIYGQADYWASPLETLARGRGDCEDFAILKMATLAHLGVPVDTMRVVIVQIPRRAELTSTMHAVLLAGRGDEAVVLDNLREDVVTVGQARDYTPIYAIRLLPGGRPMVMASNGTTGTAQ